MPFVLMLELWYLEMKIHYPSLLTGPCGRLAPTAHWALLPAAPTAHCLLSLQPTAPTVH